MKEYFFSDIKELKLDIKFPYNEMLDEAKSLRHRFVSHRDGESTGWASLTLYGLGEDKTASWQQYGFKDSYEYSKNLDWTLSINQAPVTKKFLLNNFPSKKYGRVRFMLLKAGGRINMHTDSRAPLLENINLVLNNPKNCLWRWGHDDSKFFMEPGCAYAMNISYPHEVVNNSNEDRYHMIVTRHDSTPEWKHLINTAVEKVNGSGEYKVINELP
jgi:hypothetical protein